ncbi:MAG: hypothetical protein ACYC1D_17930, partial [Acidimicrobiales bacterium]
VLDRHGVEYLIVGGGATQLYGATRPTKDSDCLVRQDKDNLLRLAGALRELNARLRISGLTDEESAALPVQIDAILSQGGSSNWSTGAGNLDIMTEMRDRAGAPRRCEDLAGDARVLDFAGVRIRVASLNAIVASKEFANRPKAQEALPELHRLQEQMRGAQRSRPKAVPPPQRRGPSHPVVVVLYRPGQMVLP